MKRHRWPILLLSLLSIAYFAPIIIRGQGFLFSDNFSHQIPTLSFWKQEVLRGRIPLWNPFLLGGIPFLADLSHNTLAPTNLLYLLLPVPLALTLMVVFFVAVAAVFSYLFVFELTGVMVASMFAAIAFAFSGTVIAAANDINSLQGIAFIPLVFYTAQLWMSYRDTRRTLFLSLALGIQLMSSHPQYTYMTWMALAAYLLLTVKRWKVRELAAPASAFVIALALTAVQVVPFVEFIRLVYRPHSLDFATQNQLQLGEIPKFVFANFYGSWRSGSSWGPSSQLESGLANTEGYSGILPLALALVAVLRVRTKQVTFWTVVALVAILLGLGSQTPLLGLARAWLPLFSKFRSPVRFLALESFAVAILAGFALAKMSRRERT